MSNARTLANTINSSSQIVVPSGGIQFTDATNANTVANQSNLIEQDGYETGTWTPDITQTVSNPTVTYTDRGGTYTKIGRLVYALGVVSWSALSAGSGPFEISGLPFTIINTIAGTPQFFSSDYNGVNFSANGTMFGGYGYNTSIRLAILSDNGGAGANIPTPAASGYFYFNLIYQV